MEHNKHEKIKEYCYKFKTYLDEEEERRKYKAQPDVSSLNPDRDNKANIGADGKYEVNDEEDNPTCHKLRLYKDSLTSAGTDVMGDYTPREKIPVEPATSELPPEEAPPSFTGYFEEGDNVNTSELRRIDLVIVLADDHYLENIKTNYLMSIIKCGLEVQIENGLMPMHKHLVFVKVHAPDSVLEEYGDIVGVKKYLKDSHLEYIKPRSSFLNRFLCFCTQLKDEKAWIQIVRKRYEPPLFYSNLERSLIVYKILLHLPFGEHVNDFGLGRLLDRDIVLDVYALHDGPYFYTKNQDFTEVSARQILFYNWTGLRNLFTMQPLNVIHEYFGSRVAFYFSFFQFYNQILVIAAIAGIAIVGFGIFDTDGYYTVRNDTCSASDDVLLCPRCTKFDKMCWLDKLNNYCLTAKIVNTLDNRLIILYCAFIIIWAKILVIFWRRKENYWLWLWELHRIKNLVTLRSQFNIDYNKPKRSTKTGIWKNYNNGVTKLITVALAIGLTLVCAAASVLFTYHLIELKYTYLLGKTKQLPVQYGRYIIIAIIVAANLLVLSLSEKVFKVLSTLITNFENHRTHESHERSLIAKQSVYGFVCTFSIFFYFAYIKGFKYIHPIYAKAIGRARYAVGRSEIKYKKPAGDDYNNCGPFRCMDELFVVQMVTQLLRQIIPKTLLCLRSYIFWIRTDYNQGKNQTKTMPSWEREYLLKPIKISSMLERFNYLAQQFGLLTLFAPAFPLAAVLALIMNIFHIRYDAEVFLLGSRRALLTDVQGIDLWNNIFNLIAYISVVINAGILCLTSRISKRYVYVSQFTNMTGFLYKTTTEFDFKLYFFYHGNFTWVTQAPSTYDKICRFPGIMLNPTQYDDEFYSKVVDGGQLSKYIHDYKPPDKMHFYYNPSYLRYELIWFKMLYHEVILLLLFLNIGMCTLLILNMIPSKPRDIEECMKVEQKIKNHFLRNKK